MLAKKYRLPVGALQNRRARIVSGRFFSLKIYTSPLSFSRLGVVVSKRVAKAATTRNKLKRFIFQYFKFRFDQFPKNDYLIIVRPGATTLSLDALEQELEKLFS